MKNYEVIEKHKRCLFNEEECMECILCDYCVDEDELLEALDKAVGVLKAADC